MATQASGWIAFLGVFRCHNMAGYDPGGLRVLFGFGPKPGCFVVQKRNKTLETPETLGTLSVDAGIVVL